MRILEKKERALGTKLFLKADRCNSGKCAMTKRPYKPGPHAKSFKKISEYGQQLMEKQKIRFSYGLTERQLKKYFDIANTSSNPTHETLITLLESRLDNALFRSGFFGSRRIAKQLISHGHITVNGRKVTIPSYLVKIDDLITIRPESNGHALFIALDEKIKNIESAEWMKIDKNKKSILIIAAPKNIEMSVDMNLVVNHYLK